MNIIYVKTNHEFFDLFVGELLKFAVYTSTGSQVPNIQTLYIHKSSPGFTRSVCSNLFHIAKVRTEVIRQSLEFRGTLLLFHILKTLVKLLPRNYDSIGKTKRKI